MDACEDVKPDQEVKAWRTPSTLWIPLLKVKTTVCLLLQLQTRLKNYKGNGENMPGAIVSFFLDCPQIYLVQEQTHGDTETSLATRLCKFEWALNFLHMVFGAVTPVQFYAQTALLSLVIVQWKT